MFDATRFIRLECHTVETTNSKLICIFINCGLYYLHSFANITTMMRIDEPNAART